MCHVPAEKSLSNLFLCVLISDPESWQQTAKVLFLKDQIKLCEALEAAEELKHWHMMLTFQLATYGTEKRLRIFLDSFLNDNGEEPATAPVGNNPPVTQYPNLMLCLFLFSACPSTS